MSDEQVMVVLYVQTNKVGSRCEYRIEWPRDEWEEMTDQDKNDAMQDVLWDSGMVDWGYEVDE